jgi:DNA-binding NtrC family response regulator
MPDDIVVLLVEDEAQIRDFLQASLEDAGMSVITADHGGDAISLLDDRHPMVRVLVTDVRLGAGPDGWALARYARKLRPELPIVYVSGSSAADWPAEGVPQSVFVQKPFGPAQMVASVRKAIAEAAKA